MMVVNPKKKSYPYHYIISYIIILKKILTSLLKRPLSLCFLGMLDRWMSQTLQNARPVGRSGSAVFPDLGEDVS